MTRAIELEEEPPAKQRAFAGARMGFTFVSEGVEWLATAGWDSRGYWLRLRLGTGVNQARLRTALAAVDPTDAELSAAIKVCLCTMPCDRCRSFDGHSMLAEHVLRCNPLSAHRAPLRVLQPADVSAGDLLLGSGRVGHLGPSGWRRGRFRIHSATRGARRSRACELEVPREGIDLATGPSHGSATALPTRKRKHLIGLPEARS